MTCGSEALAQWILTSLSNPYPGHILFFPYYLFLLFLFCFVFNLGFLKIVQNITDVPLFILYSSWIQELLPLPCLTMSVFCSHFLLEYFSPLPSLEKAKLLSQIQL